MTLYTVVSFQLPSFSDTEIQTCRNRSHFVALYTRLTSDSQAMRLPLPLVLGLKVWDCGHTWLEMIFWMILGIPMCVIYFLDGTGRSSVYLFLQLVDFWILSSFSTGSVNIFVYTLVCIHLILLNMCQERNGHGVYNYQPDFHNGFKLINNLGTLDVTLKIHSCCLLNTFIKFKWSVLERWLSS